MKKLDDDRHFTLFSWNVPVWTQNLYMYAGFFTFGAFCCQSATDIAKYSIGRLRPHFLNVREIINKIVKTLFYWVLSFAVRLCPMEPTAAIQSTSTSTSRRLTAPTEMQPIKCRKNSDCHFRADMRALDFTQWFLRWSVESEFIV